MLRELTCMLSIGFLGITGQHRVVVTLTDELYLWLAQSQFAQIGQSQDIELEIKGERVCLPLVVLEPDNRSLLRDFFHRAVIEEQKAVLARLDHLPSEDVYQAQTYRLRKLQELYQHIENEHFQYLQRV